MFRLLRTHMKKILLGTILLIVPPFVIWGINSDEDNKGNLTAGKIYGKRVTLNEFLQARDACMLNLYLVYGPDFRDLLGLVDMNRQAWDRLLFLAEVRRQGIVISDQEVIAQVERFFSKNGVFDKENYAAFLERAGIPAVVFEDRIRGTLAVGRLSRMVSDTAFVGWDEVQDAYRRQGEKAEASVIALRAKDYAKKVALQEQDARAYVEQHGEDFRIPERVRVRYVLIRPEPSAAKTEDAKQKAMDAAFEKATDLSMKLFDEPDLEKAAKISGLKIQVTEFFTAGDAKPPLESREFLQAAFRIEPGKNSPVLRTPQGFALLNVLEKQASRVPEFAEIREQALAKASEQAAQQKMMQDAQKLRDQISAAMASGKGSFADLAKGLGLKAETTGSFTRTSALEGFPASSVFRNACFETPVGGITPVCAFDGGVMFGSVQKRQAGTLAGFEKEKDALLSQLLNRKRDALLNAWFENLKRQAKFEDRSAELAEIVPAAAN